MKLISENGAYTTYRTVASLNNGMNLLDFDCAGILSACLDNHADNPVTIGYSYTIMYLVG